MLFSLMVLNARFAGSAVRPHQNGSRRCRRAGSAPTPFSAASPSWYSPTPKPGVSTAHGLDRPRGMVRLQARPVGPVPEPPSRETSSRCPLLAGCTRTVSRRCGGIASKRFTGIVSPPSKAMPTHTESSGLLAVKTMQRAGEGCAAGADPTCFQLARRWV